MSSGPSLVDNRGLSGTPTFGKSPPLGISRPPSFGLKKPSLSTAKDGSFDVKREWTALAPASSIWNVKADELEPVPMDFPLERTNREITNADGREVASRITQVLSSLSIEAEFDCEKAKAKCKTSDYVAFRIRLYAGGEGGQPVVVEVQRRCGSTSSFMRSCRAILDAAEGKEAIATPAKKVPPFMKKPIGQMKCLQSAVSNDKDQTESVKCAESALDGVVSMLRSKMHDTNILALENLCCLTDPVKTSPSVALVVSKCVCFGCDGDKLDIREEIRALTERDVFSPGYEHDETQKKQMDHLRHLAFMVFANALSMTSKDGCLGASIKDQKWFGEYLIPALCDELRMASTNTCNAHQAASCLTSLLACSSHARRLFMDNGGTDVLKEAKEFGETRHALLAEETGRCLKALDVPPSSA